ncbi:MAG: hypothetical protein K0R92_22 [Lachnospiraceae bacterium]|jgi:uncharacterized protein YlxP (DUF503 family)|nr:hypothetical protein [Lachnospiraceae bacterium]
MIIAVTKISIHTPWVHSLKEKRMVVKSLCGKVSNKFNVSIAEVEEQDKHQLIVLGVAGVAGDTTQADSIIDHVVNFIESNTEGEIIKIQREII